MKLAGDVEVQVVPKFQPNPSGFLAARGPHAPPPAAAREAHVRLLSASVIA